MAWLERSAIVSELSHFVMVNMVAGRGSGLRVAVMNRLGQLFILNALMGFRRPLRHMNRVRRILQTV